MFFHLFLLLINCQSFSWDSIENEYVLHWELPCGHLFIDIMDILVQLHDRPNHGGCEEAFLQLL